MLVRSNSNLIIRNHNTCLCYSKQILCFIFLPNNRFQLYEPVFNACLFTHFLNRPCGSCKFHLDYVYVYVWYSEKNIFK